jgi:hypothetical protein
MVRRQKLSASNLLLETFNYGSSKVYTSTRLNDAQAAEQQVMRADCPSDSRSIPALCFWLE